MEGRTPKKTAGIGESQTTNTTEEGAPCGFGAREEIMGAGSAMLLGPGNGSRGGVAPS